MAIENTVGNGAFISLVMGREKLMDHFLQ